jgi:hypothetical protein
MHIPRRFHGHYPHFTLAPFPFLPLTSLMPPPVVLALSGWGGVPPPGVLIVEAPGLLMRPGARDPDKSASRAAGLLDEVVRAVKGQEGGDGGGDDGSKVGTGGS